MRVLARTYIGVIDMDYTLASIISGNTKGHRFQILVPRIIITKEQLLNNGIQPNDLKLIKSSTLFKINNEINNMLNQKFLNILQKYIDKDIYGTSASHYYTRSSGFKNAWSHQDGNGYIVFNISDTLIGERSGPIFVTRAHKNEERIAVAGTKTFPSYTSLTDSKQKFCDINLVRALNIDTNPGLKGKNGNPKDKFFDQTLTEFMKWVNSNSYIIMCCDVIKYYIH